MSIRLSLLALLMLAYLVLLLLNLEKVAVTVFFFEFNIPLMYIIALSTAFGIFISFLFVWLGSKERKLKARLREFEKRFFQEKKQGQRRNQSSVS